MDISASLMTKFHTKWGDKEHCPYQVYRTSILRDVEYDSESMAKGRYFETQCLGRSLYGSQDDLPRLKNGNKSADHNRIDAQVMQFELQRRNFFVDVNRFNVQVELKMRLNDDFNLVGHLDIFPTSMIDVETNLFHMAFIDLKLAEDSTNTWGDYCWGTPHNIDSTQMVAYHVLIRNMDNPLNDLEGYPESVLKLRNDVRGYYWVFGYKNGGFKPIEVTFTPDKIQTFKEDLRRTMSLVTKYEAEGWQPVASKLCDRCPIYDCKARTTVQKV